MANSPWLTALRAPLTLPFGLVGLCGGAIVASRLVSEARGGPMSAFLTLGTGIVAGRLGWLLSRGQTEAPAIEPWWLRVTVRAVVAGGLNGVLLLAALMVTAVLTAPRTIRSDGLAIAVPAAAGAWIFGALLALAFVPSLLVVAGLGERGRAARAGSGVHVVLQSATWLAAALLVLVHGALALHTAPIRYDDDGQLLPRSYRDLGPLLFVVATAVAALLSSTVRGALALRDSLRLASSLERRGSDHAAMAVVADPRCADLGLGDAEWVEVQAGEDPYRDAARAVVRVVGDPSAAKNVVRDAAVWLAVSVPLASVLSLGWLHYFR